MEENPLRSNSKPSSRTSNHGNVDNKLLYSIEEIELEDAFVEGEFTLLRNTKSEDAPVTLAARYNWGRIFVFATHENRIIGTHIHRTVYCELCNNTADEGYKDVSGLSLHGEIKNKNQICIDCINSINEEIDLVVKKNSEKVLAEFI